MEFFRARATRGHRCSGVTTRGQCRVKSRSRGGILRRQKKKKNSPGRISQVHRSSYMYLVLISFSTINDTTLRKKIPKEISGDTFIKTSHKDKSRFTNFEFQRRYHKYS